MWRADVDDVDVGGGVDFSITAIDGGRGFGGGEVRRNERLAFGKRGRANGGDNVVSFGGGPGKGEIFYEPGGDEASTWMGSVGRGETRNSIKEMLAYL